MTGCPRNRQGFEGKCEISLTMQSVHSFGALPVWFIIVYSPVLTAACILVITFMD